MSWVKLDDGFIDHPKVIGLSDRAVRAYLAGLCYAGRHLTDGNVPPPVAKGFRRRVLAELVDAGLWEKNGTGYTIHDFLTYNRSREQVANERRTAAERMVRVRANKRRSSAVDPGVPTEPLTRARARAPRAALDTTPTPTPGYYVGRCESCGAALTRQRSGAVTGHDETCQATRP